MNDGINVVFLYEGTVADVNTFVGTDTEALNKRAEEYFIHKIKEELNFTLISFQAFNKSVKAINKELRELDDEEFANSLIEDGVWSGYDKEICIHHGRITEV